MIKDADRACTNLGLLLLTMVSKNQLQLHQRKEKKRKEKKKKESTTEKMLEAIKAICTLPLEAKMKYMTRDHTAPIDYALQSDGTWLEVLYHQGYPASSEIILFWPSKLEIVIGWDRIRYESINIDRIKKSSI